MKIAEQASQIKTMANYRYTENMTKKEAKVVCKQQQEAEWNKLYLSILKLAADGIDTLHIVNPCGEERTIKRLRQSGFKLQLEKAPDETLRRFGDKDAMRVKRIIVKW